MADNTPTKKKNLVEILALSALFFLLVMISYYHVKQSFSLIKYGFPDGIEGLLRNYFRYHRSFSTLLSHTTTYNPGGSQSSNHNIFYLGPLFLFCDLLGGLSLKTMYLFSITISLVFIGVFYLWVKESWGKQTALYSAFFLGFSSVFQEFARSSTCHTYNLFIGMIWVLFFFYCSKTEHLKYFFLLGLLTGLTWYGYGTLRFLTLCVISYIIFLKNSRKLITFSVFLTGMIIVLLPGFLTLLEKQHIYSIKDLTYIIRCCFDTKTLSAFETHRGAFRTILFNLNIMGHALLGALLGAKESMAPFPGPYASLNSLLSVPLLIGIWRTIRSGRKLQNQLLLLLFLSTFLVPCFILIHFHFARQHLLLLIPVFCFYGLGTKEIVTWINNIRKRNIKYVIACLFAFLLYTILIQEMLFFKTVIISSQRDFTGLLTFVNKIKTNGPPTENIYGLQGPTRKPYIYKECSLMRMALINKGQSYFQTIPINSNIPSLNLPKNFYLCKGPMISQQLFDTWCENNRLKASLILNSPVINMYQEKEPELYSNSYALYAIQKTD